MGDKLQLMAFMDFSAIDKQFVELQNRAKGTKLEFGSGTTQLDQLSNSAQKANKQINTLGKSILDIPLKFAKWYLVSGIVTGLFGSFRDGIDTVFELDKAVTNIAFTMDLTEREMSGLVTSSFEMAEAFNASVHEVMVANQVFSNMNETLSSVNDKTRVTIELANLTGSSVSQMADALQGLLYQFDLTSDKTQEISDVLVTLAQQTGVEFSRSILEMSRSVSRAGSVANEAGYSYNQFLATISTLQEQSRLTGSSLSSGLVTMLSRMTRVADSSAEEISKIEGALKQVGVQLRDSNGEFRNSFDVLNELSQVYGSLNSVQRAEIGFLVAGTRQRKVFNTMMSSMSEIVDRAEGSLENEGETMRLNDIYAESLAGRVADLNNSLEKLFDTILKSGALKSFVTGLTNVVDYMDLIANNMEVLIIPAVFTLRMALPLLAGGITFVTGAVAELNVAMAISAPQFYAIALAVGVVSGAYLKMRKEAMETERAQEKFIESSKALQQVIDTGNKESLEQSQKELIKLKDGYNEATDALAKFKDENTAVLTGGRGEFGQYLSQLGDLEDGVADAENKLLEFGVTTDKIDDTLEQFGVILSSIEVVEFVEEVQQARTDVDVLNDAMSELNETGEISSQTFFELSERLPKLAEALSVNQDKVEEYHKVFSNMTNNQVILQQELTRVTIEETKKRIISYQNEIDSIGILMRNVDDTLGSLQLEKREIALKSNLETQLSYLDEMLAKQKGLELVLDDINDKKKDRTKKTKELTEEEKGLLDVEFDIATTESELNRLEGTDRVKSLEKLIKLQEDRKKALTTLKASLDEVKMGTDAYTAEIRKLTLEQSNSINMIDQYGKELEQIPLDEQAKLVAEYKEELSELKDELGDLKKALDAQVKEAISLIKKQRDEEVRAIQDTIERKETEIDKINEANRAREDSLRLAKLESEVLKDDEKLKKTLAEEDTRIFINGRFVFTANPEAVSQAEEELAESREALEQETYEQREENRVRELQKEIDNLKKEKEETKQAFDDKIDALKEFQARYKAEMDVQGEIQKKTLDGINNALSRINSTYFNQTISGYKSMVRDINDALDDIKSVETKIEKGSSKKSVKSKSSSSRILVSGDPVSNLNYLNTGGIIKKEGLFYGHSGEPVLNPDQTANLSSALGLPVGDAMQNANNLYNIANNPKSSLVGSNSGTDSSSGRSITIQSMKVIADKPNEWARQLDEFANSFK